jgi:tetratricopeptide (TPR) repeat protein
MASKTKTSEIPASAPDASVEKLFSEGLELLNAGKLEQAAAAFTQVQEAAIKAERLNLGRTVRGYLAAIQARLHEQGAGAKENAEFSIQLLLNQKNPQAALEALGKAIQAGPERVALHYLKAVAHAQLGQGQESAEALGRAAELDPDILFQFRLEPDFDGIRHSAPFAALLRN